MKASKKTKYLGLARELKILWKLKETVISIIVGALGTVRKSLEKRLKGLEIRGRTKTFKSTAIFTQKNPGDIRRLSVTQTLVKDLNFLGETLKE